MRLDLGDDLRRGEKKIVAVFNGVTSQFKADRQYLCDVFRIVNSGDDLGSRIETLGCSVSGKSSLFVHQPEHGRAHVLRYRFKHSGALLKKTRGAIAAGG